MRFTYLGVFVLVAFIGSAAAGDVISVPGDHATIAGAIAASVDGDTVLVAAGTYVENIHFGGKAITVQSESGPLVTTIDGGGSGSVVSFVDGEGNASVLEGFTITNGTGTCVTSQGGDTDVFGAGVYCLESGPSIRKNIITGNVTSCAAAGGAPVIGSGGGIAVIRGPSARILDNTIQGNTATRGGGIFSDNNAAIIRRNQVLDNMTTGDLEQRLGGGIFTVGLMSASGCLVIDRNLIDGNAAHHGGGIYCADLLCGSIANCEISNNSVTGDGGGVHVRMIDDHLLAGSINIERCKLHHNHADLVGGGAFLTGLTQIPEDTRGPAMRSCRVYGNTAGAGAAGAHNGSDAGTFSGNLVYGNEAASGAGGLESLGFWHFIGGNTIVDNIGDGLNWFDGLMESNIIRGNTGVQNLGGPGLRNNIEGEDPDPLFVNAGGADYRLRLGSPCIDAGTPLVAPATDIDGDPRFLDGDGDGIGGIDIGADEVVPEHVVLFGTVNAAGGAIEDVLFLNSTAGDASRSVEVSDGGPITLEMNRPSTGGPGKYVLHANLGSPDLSLFSVLPAGVGTVAFPLLLSNGASPIAIFNGRLGKQQHVGASTYFDGTPIPDPERAPAIVLDLPTGDAVNLPPGTDITFQGVVVDLNSTSPKRASVTNGILMLVR